MTTPFPRASILGYPRIGPNRELKRALESFWSGDASGDELAATAHALASDRTARLNDLGLTETAAIPEDFSYYDQVLDLIVALGAVPTRFAAERDILSTHAPDSPQALHAQFTIARGEGTRAALELTKWFDSNYHYLVPEIGPETDINWLGSPRVDSLQSLGGLVRPVFVGPVTFLLLAKPTEDAPADFHPLDRLDDVVAAYSQLVSDLQDAGAQWIQFDEPALVSDRWSVDRERILSSLTSAYTGLSAATDTAQLAVALTYGHAFDAVDALAATAISAVAIDVVRGRLPGSAELHRWSSSLAGKALALGIVSGRNIWRTDLDAALVDLRAVETALGPDVRVCVTTSTSLQHVPHDAEREVSIDPEIRSWLAFADQKAAEAVTLAKGLVEGDEAIRNELTASRNAWSSRAAHPGVHRAVIRESTANITDADRSRVDFQSRAEAQREALSLPLLPTTTIGSFPQTIEIRRARAAHRKGTLSTSEYESAMREEIKHVIRAQEDIGLDVLVHGEPERNDMVQYFAEHLEGFVTTEHGWVQSYGSRCTRPSILWGDVSRSAPITVEWSGYAVSLTDRVVKGMLTGPVTIMAWSFVREDIPWAQVGDQIGLALRDEIADLESTGVKVIQVDEPAIRELLPLRASESEHYLEWSVGAFRLATSGAAPTTSIHTHLCYSDFATIVDAIDRLDADVTSIEASRSKMEVLPALAEHGYTRGLGPGVWDIHSPRVPSADEMTDLLRTAASALSPHQLWVNPDCGLKTRGWPEVTATLRNLVEAAQQIRSELHEGPRISE